MKPSELKIGLQIVIFDTKTLSFLKILKNPLFHVLTLLGIHLRPFELSWAHFWASLGVPLGSSWALLGSLGPLWESQELLGGSLGTILAYFDLPLGSPGRP